MPDENRFARLGEAIGESSGETPEPEESEESPEREPSEPTPEADSESDGGREETSDDETEEVSDGETEEATAERPPEEADGGPAFEFEDTTAKSVYVRPKTVDVLDDAEFEVESYLRREHGVRDMAGREFHDALVRVAAEHPDEVADAIRAARDDGR